MLISTGEGPVGLNFKPEDTLLQLPAITGAHDLSPLGTRLPDRSRNQPGQESNPRDDRQ